MESTDVLSSTPAPRHGPRGHAGRRLDALATKVGDLCGLVLPALLLPMALPGAVRALEAPTGLQVTSTSETHISLSWTAPPDDGGGPIEAYNVYRCDEGATPCILTGDSWIAWVEDGTRFTDTHDDSTAHEAGGTSPLVPGQTYRYAVGAYRDGGGDWSQEVTAVAENEGARAAWLFPSAADPVRQGFARVLNRSAEDGEVQVLAIDDRGNAYGPTTLSIGAGRTVHFNSGDLESGNASKGMPEGVGPGEGDWRLEFETELNIQIASYIRTADGFLTAMHDVAPLADGAWRVVTFNPGDNPNQVSRLRLVNPGDEAAEVTITGIDDAGASPGSEVRLSVPPGASTTLTADELEKGSALDGALGDGQGKWRLSVRADQPLTVMSLLSSPTGHLTNLSTTPRAR